MREKDIKKLIKQEIESHIPQEAPKLDFVFAQKAETTLFNRFKSIFNVKLVLSTMVTAALVFLVVSLQLGPISPTIQAYQFESDEQIISFSALSTTALLSVDTTEPLSNGQILTLNNPTQEALLIDHIEPYLDLAEKFLKEDQLLVTELDSELPDYQSKIEFQMNDLTGKPTTYTMHYNMTLISNEFDEEEYEINGILVKGALTYQIYGLKEIEEDEEEFKFRASFDSLNYVESSYEIDTEDNEKKFKYLTYTNGVLVSESKIKIEIENEKTQFELEYKKGSDEGTFQFEYVTLDAKDLILIEFESEVEGISLKGEMTVEVVIDEITGLSNYVIFVKTDDEDEGRIFDRDRDDDDNDPSEPEESEDEETEPEESENEDNEEEEDEQDTIPFEDVEDPEDTIAEEDETEDEEFEDVEPDEDPEVSEPEENDDEVFHVIYQL